jgi:hypothetical protein
LLQYETCRHPVYGTFVGSLLFSSVQEQFCRMVRGVALIDKAHPKGGPCLEPGGKGAYLPRHYRFRIVSVKWNAENDTFGSFVCDNDTQFIEHIRFFFAVYGGKYSHRRKSGIIAYRTSYTATSVINAQ